MDAAYDSKIIKEQTERLGKIAIIDSNPRRGENDGAAEAQCTFLVREDRATAG